MELEPRVEKVERKIKTVEEAIILLTALTTSHDDRLEKLLFGIEELRASQNETKEKINMLIDAQMRTENNTEELQASQKETNEKINILIDAQIKTEDKVSDLTDAVLSAHQRIDKIEE